MRSRRRPTYGCTSGRSRDEIDAFVQTAETDVCHAEAALSHALAGSEVSAEELQRLYAAHVRRAIESTEAVRRVCISAREQHVTARRLLSRLEEDDSAEPQTTPHGVGVLVVDMPKTCAIWSRSCCVTPAFSSEPR